MQMWHFCSCVPCGWDCSFVLGHNLALLFQGSSQIPNKVYLLKGDHKLPQGCSYPILYNEKKSWKGLLYFLLLELVGWNRDRD